MRRPSTWRPGGHRARKSCRPEKGQAPGDLRIHRVSMNTTKEYPAAS